MNEPKPIEAETQGGSCAPAPCSATAPTCTTCIHNRPYYGVMCHECRWWPYFIIRDHYRPDPDKTKSPNAKGQP